LGGEKKVRLKKEGGWEQNKKRTPQRGKKTGARDEKKSNTRPESFKKSKRAGGGRKVRGKKAEAPVATTPRSPLNGKILGRGNHQKRKVKWGGLSKVRGGNWGRKKSKKKVNGKNRVDARGRRPAKKSATCPMISHRGGKGGKLRGWGERILVKIKVLTRRTMSALMEQGGCIQSLGPEKKREGEMGGRDERCLVPKRGRGVLTHQRIRPGGGTTRCRQ